MPHQSAESINKRGKSSSKDSSNGETEYSWKEIKKHNSPDDAWVSYGDGVYDITGWRDKHPGGGEYIDIAAGRDITDLVISYHPFSNKPEIILKKYRIGKVKNAEYELNSFAKDTGFYKECINRVQDYFKREKLNYKDPVPGLVRLIFFISMLVITFPVVTGLVPVAYPVWLVCGTIFGVVQGLILLHCMHDASHSSIGGSPAWWTVVGRLTMDWIAGASMTSWLHQHVLGHHIYTNIMGADPDLPVLEDGDLRYLVDQQRWKWLYKFQWIYMPVLYGALGLKFRMQDISDTFLGRQNGPVRVNPVSLSILAWVEMVGVKLLHIILRFYIPLFVAGISWKETITSYLFTEIITGYWLAYNFQVSHVSTSAEFPLFDHKALTPAQENEWAVIQVITSVDYSHGNWWATFFSGALNYQTVHHLFPGVSQYHYPALAPIIMEVCKKYGVRYNVAPSYLNALKLHIEYLYEKGNRINRK